MSSSAPTGPTLRIFIAYRRDDSQGFARSIHDRLAGHFGADAVFRDINDIEPGMPWEEAIDEALGTCDVFVLLIGREWLEARDDEGNRRLDDPEDRHRREIETAISRKIRIFVALMEDASMPRRKQMPAAAAPGQESEGLQKVPALHALRIADYAFDYGIGELISGIERAVEQERESQELRRLEAEEERELAAEQERAQEQRRRAEEESQRAEEERRRAEEERQADALPRPGGGEERTGERKRGVPMVAAIALGAVVLVVAIVLIVSSGGDGPEPAEVVGEPVKIGDFPVELADDGAGGIWVTDRVGDRIARVEIGTDDQQVGTRVEAGPEPEGVAVGGGSLWVSNGGGTSVSRRDPATGGLIEDVPVGARPAGIAVGGDAAWVANNGKGESTVSRIDLATHDVEPVTVESEPYGVAIDADGVVWVTNRGSSSVSRIDPGTHRVIGDAIPVGENPKGIDVSDDAAWIANTDSDSVTRIDTGTQEKETFQVGREPRGIVAAFDSIWVSLGEENDVARLDPESGEVSEQIPVGDGPEGITSAGDSVWVASGEDRTVTRIRP